MEQEQLSTKDATAACESETHVTEFCPRFHKAIELIGKRWTGAILRVLIDRPHRFNEILATVPGLSDRLLTDRLRELEENSLVTRKVMPGPPVRVEYELTARGRDLEVAVRAISSWAEKWFTNPSEA